MCRDGEEEDECLPDGALVERLITEYESSAPEDETPLRFLRRSLAHRWVVTHPAGEDDDEVPRRSWWNRRKKDRDASPERRSSSSPLSSSSSSFISSIKAYACNGRDDVHSVLALLVRHPEAARSDDYLTMSHMKCVLSHALRQTTSPAVVRCMLEACSPAVLTFRDSHGKTLLLEAASHCKSEVFRAVLEANPDAASLHKYEAYIIQLMPGGMTEHDPKAHIFVKVGERYSYIMLPEPPSDDGTVTLKMDPNLPIMSENVVSCAGLDPLTLAGSCTVTAPRGVRPGGKFVATVRGRTMNIRYPRWKLMRGSGLLRVNLPPLPPAVIEGEKLTTFKAKDGQIPLHVASATKKVQLLLQQYPRGVTVKDVTGSIPLHYVNVFSLDGPKKSAEFLLEEGENWKFDGGVRGDKGILVKNHDGKTPLDTLCSSVLVTLREDRSWARHFHSAVQAWELLETYCQTAYEALMNDNHIGGVKCDAGGFSLPTDAMRSNSCRGERGRFFTLHSIVGTGCPVEIVQHALSRYPSQVTRCDFTGRNVLSVAAQSYRLKSDERLEALKALSSGSLFATSGRTTLAATRDCWGRLPLHWALEGRVGRVVRKKNADEKKEEEGGGGGEEDDNYDNEIIVNAVIDLSPWIVEVMDPVTKLFPFMQAAVDDSNGIDTVYNLLRQSPAILNSLACLDGGSGRGERAVSLTSSSMRFFPVSRSFKNFAPCAQEGQNVHRRRRRSCLPKGWTKSRQSAALFSVRKKRGQSMQ